MIDIKKSISDALELCKDSYKNDSTPSAIIDALKTQNTKIHSIFRYSIARDIAKFIICYYGNIVREIRLCGSTMENNAGKYSDIDLIIHAKKLGQEILLTLKSLDRPLTEQYYKLIDEEADVYSYLLDVHIIDDDITDHHDSSKAYLQYILQNNSVWIA